MRVECSSTKSNSAQRRRLLQAGLAAFIASAAEKGIHSKFADVERKRNFRPDDLAAGRAYVASYVSFVHYVEGLHQAASSQAAGHYAEDGQPVVAAHAE